MESNILEFQLSDDPIFRCFKKEWSESNHYLYKEFINYKNLGIIWLINRSKNHCYEIIDEKKWLLTKLKYGI